MQQMRNNVDTQETPLKEISYNGQTYVKSKYPVTQPPILNVIKGSVLKGAFYAVLSLVLLFFLMEGSYLHFLGGDIIMFAGLLFLLFLRHQTLNGKVKMVSNFDSANISVGGVCVGLMWSSIVRLSLFAYQFMVGEYSVPELKYFFIDSGLRGKISPIIGLIVFGIGYACLFGFKDFNVKSYHNQTVLYYKNLLKASEKIQEPETPKQTYTPTKFEYGDLSTASPAPKPEPKKQKVEKIQIPHTVKVSSEPEKPPVDKLKQKQVKRKKRNID